MREVNRKHEDTHFVIIDQEGKFAGSYHKYGEALADAENLAKLNERLYIVYEAREAVSFVNIERTTRTFYTPHVLSEMAEKTPPAQDKVDYSAPGDNVVDIRSPLERMAGDPKHD